MSRSLGSVIVVGQINIFRIERKATELILAGNHKELVEYEKFERDALLRF